MAKENCKIFAYVDDFIGVASRPVAATHFQKLSDLLTELGLPMNPHKKTPPCRSLTCLGITIDIDAATLQIDKSKLQAIYEACLQIRHKKFFSKKTFQSLIGKLIYVHKCVQPAQIFINSILALFRNNAHKKRIKLNEEFFKDIHWFLTFLPSYNGISYFDKQDVEHCDSLYLDASLSGLGAVWANRVYSSPVLAIPGFTFTIVHLEMLNIVLALRTWGHFWHHRKIQIFCDNMVVVQVVGSSKTKDPFLAACIRNIWLIAASFDIQIDIKHIPGKKNAIADLLSRLHSISKVDLQLLSILQQHYIWDKINVKKFKLDLYI